MVMFPEAKRSTRSLKASYALLWESVQSLKKIELTQKQETEACVQKMLFIQDLITVGKRLLNSTVWREKIFPQEQTNDQQITWLFV